MNRRVSYGPRQHWRCDGLRTCRRCHATRLVWHSMRYVGGYCTTNTYSGCTVYIKHSTAVRASSYQTFLNCHIDMALHPALIPLATPTRASGLGDGVRCATRDRLGQRGRWSWEFIIVGEYNHRCHMTPHCPTLSLYPLRLVSQRQRTGNDPAMPAHRSVLRREHVNRSGQLAPRSGRQIGR